MFQEIFRFYEFIDEVVEADEVRIELFNHRPLGIVLRVMAYDERASQFENIQCVFTEDVIVDYKHTLKQRIEYLCERLNLRLKG